MTLQELIAKKKEMGLSCADISERSGVPFGTVQKIFGGVTKTPKFATLQKLSKVFEYKYDFSVDGHQRVVQESYAYLPDNTNYYDRQGTYTFDDYYALPDEQRVELIDGVFYDMSAPTGLHQLLAGEIHARLREFILKNKGKCVPYIAPADVQLDGIMDNRTMVQPDVFVICDLEKNKNIKRIVGAPDFVVEVLSPSTRRKDMTKKLQKYADAGVREYWLIDPDKGRVITYDMTDDCRVAIYTFKDKVPVMIYDGKLEIDFADMPAYITRYYDEDGNLIEQ